MRTPEYLSPSSLKTFEKNQDEFYLKYLADKKPPRLKQTAPMAVGSGFDARVKSYLYYALYGNYGADDAYKFENIFNKQVEEHARPQALIDSEIVFNSYKHSGALSDLMLELNTSINTPRFEFDVRGTIQTKVGDVPMLGKPDIFFINSEGARVIPDWKVNGFYSAKPPSPKKGFIKIRDGWTSDKGPPSKGNGMPHKDCYPTVKKGIKINPTLPFEAVDEEWADQLSIYGWLVGEEPGSTDLIAGIEQIVGGPPFLRIASHRAITSAPYQYALLSRIEKAWGAIKGGKRGFFANQGLNEEESEARCNSLEDQAAALGEGDDLAHFINETSRTR
jgi:hypothetical protein